MLADREGHCLAVAAAVATDVSGETSWRMHYNLGGESRRVRVIAAGFRSRKRYPSSLVTMDAGSPFPSPDPKRARINAPSKTGRMAVLGVYPRRIILGSLFPVADVTHPGAQNAPRMGHPGRRALEISSCLLLPNLPLPL